MNYRNPSATPGPPVVDGPHHPEHDPTSPDAWNAAMDGQAGAHARALASQIRGRTVNVDETSADNLAWFDLAWVDAHLRLLEKPGRA